MSEHVFNDEFCQQAVVMDHYDPSTYTVHDLSTGKKVAHIHMQSGKVEEVGVNGVSIESLVAICLHRLQQLNEPPNKNVTYRQALNHLTSVLLMLETRNLNIRDPNDY